MKRTRIVISLTLTFLILCVCYFVSPFFFHKCQYSTFEICSICAEAKHLTEYYMPLTHFEIYQREDLGKPQLCEVIYKYNLVGKHQHVWQLCYAHSPEILCALGTGQNAASGASNSNVAMFIEMLTIYHGKATAQHYVKNILSEGSYGRYIQGVVRESRSVYNTHSKAQFERFWKEIKPDLDKIEKQTSVFSDSLQ